MSTYFVFGGHEHRVQTITFISYKRPLLNLCFTSIVEYNQLTIDQYSLKKMKSVIIFIFFASISAVYCGGPSPCEPFVSNFHAFEQALLNIVDQFRNLIIGKV